MKTDCGLYVSVTLDRTLKRDFAAIHGKASLADTTAEDEIITFSELDFGPYAEVVDLIITSTAFIPHEDHIEDADMNVFQFILDAATDLVTTLEQEEEDPLHGTLARAMIEDRISADDGLTSRYYFHSISDYYYFLLVHFIATKPNVALCECCGRYFIPATRRKTLYCDRELKDGKTCKELAPALKHRLDARRKKAIEEFDRAKRRMYKRYERAGDSGRKPSRKDLGRSEYYEWLERAAETKDPWSGGSARRRRQKSLA